MTFSLAGQDGKNTVPYHQSRRNCYLRRPEARKGKYTITETKTAAGMTLLAEPITVTLPLTMTEQEAKKSGADLTKGYLHSDGNYYFYDLTYRVTNNATLDMPASGGHGFPIAVCGAALAAAGILLASTKRKEKKNGVSAFVTPVYFRQSGPAVPAGAAATKIKKIIRKERAQKDGHKEKLWE